MALACSFGCLFLCAETLHFDLHHITWLEESLRLHPNQDGMLSYEEVQAILPEVTTDTFMAVDADGDCLINADELAMAQTEGLMPEADS